MLCIRVQFYLVDCYYFKTYKMKKSFLSLLLAGGVILSLLSGCQTETMPKTFASVAKVTPDLMSAEVTLKTSGLSEYAYLCFPSSQTPVEDPQVIFATGTVGELVDGDNTFVVRDIEPESDYTVVVAFKSGAETFYDRNVHFDIRTADYVESFTTVATYPDGFKFHIKVPQSVKDAGNALRYNVGSLPFYLAGKVGWRTTEDALALLQNGQKSTTEDITLVYNNDNVEVEVEDPWSGEMVYDMLHTPFVPGEPIVFAAGEYALGEPEDNPWGMNQSDYFVPLFDYDAYDEYLFGQGGGWGPLAVEVDGEGYPEDQFWTGYFTRRFVTLPAPAALDANVDIKADMAAVKGSITITPDANVYQYCLMVLDEGSYQMLLPYIDNNEDYLQWMVTSYFGMYQGASTIQGPVKVDLNEYFYSVEPETDYHVLLTAMGDETGMTQKFYHEIVSTTAKTLPAPVVEVKPINNPNTSEASPYEVWFNVKCTSKTATKVKYAANYEREFGLMLNVGYTYDNIVDYMGNSFSDEEVAMINSDEGLNVMFSSMPDSKTLLAVLAYNEEDTPNTIGDGSSALASATSLREPDKAKVDSPLFEALLGDWTMSAATMGTNYSYENYDGGVRDVKVSISAGFTYPETLPEEVYETYKELAGMDRDAVTALYDEFKQEVDEFNAKLKGQNRLLCLGFGYDYEASDNHWATSAFTPESAFDLFCSKDYNGYDNESMLWDCGPKWYLEIKEDGSVVAPIHMGRMYPMKSTSSALYMVAVDRSEEGSLGFLSSAPDEENLEFPISVSADNASFTIEPYEYSDVPFYAEAMTLNSYGYAQYAGYQINGVPTFTKGWTETASAKSVSKPSDYAPEFERKSIKPLLGTEFKSNFTVKSKTAFGAAKQYKTVTLNKVDVEEGVKKYVESCMKSYATKR